MACDGGQIARDDIRDLETIQHRNELWKELFANAARIRNAMPSNAWLRPIFRKYKIKCREILEQKRKEATFFVAMCDYCDAAGDANGMKPIREELEQIHARIKILEDHNDVNDDTASTSDLSDDSEDDEDVSDRDEEDVSDRDEVEDVSDRDEDVSDRDEDEDASVSSSSSSIMDLEDFL